MTPTPNPTAAEEVKPIAGYEKSYAVTSTGRVLDHEYIDIVLDGPPDHESGRFVEIEDSSGASVKVGEWIERDGGYWALRIRTSPDAGKPEPTHRCGFCRYPFPAEEGDPDGCKYAKCMICGSEDDWEPIEGTPEIFPGTQSALDALCEAYTEGKLT